MSQEQVQIPEKPTDVLRIVEKIQTAKFAVIKVPKPIYSALRSFVESSTKDIYDFNRPETITNDVVVFRKCKKWCWEVGVRGTTARLIIYVKRVPAFEIILDASMRVKIADFEAYVKDGQFEPAENVPYAVPVSFHAIRRKLEHYISIANECKPTTIELAQL